MVSGTGYNVKRLQAWLAVDESSCEEFVAEKLVEVLTSLCSFVSTALMGRCVCVCVIISKPFMYLIYCSVLK